MEDIFNDVPRNKPDRVTLKQKVSKLRGEGKSWRECEEILNTPQTTLRRVCQSVPKVSESVPESCQSVPNVSPATQCIPITNIEIKKILKDFEANLLEKVENTTNERVQKAINYYVQNRLSETVLHIINNKKEVIEGS